MTDPTRADGLRPKRLRRWLLALGVIVALASPWWSRPLLRQLAFFHVRHVEVRGARFATPADLVARLRIDTTFSIWNDLAPLEARVRLHPQIAEVEIGRRLPSTLVLQVVESDPVAFAPSPTGFRAYDATGRLLPLDPARTPVDLPIIARRDTTLLRLLGELKAAEPNLYARVSELRRTGKEELVLDLVSALEPTIPVRMMSDISVDRLAQVSLVERDLLLRHARVHELDFRFKDQVIARLQ
jgi:cell division protein FtsQ